jgi:hypothetical protein
MVVGNNELLETAKSRVEVFSRGRGSKGETTEQLHQWVLGGE